MIHDLRRQGLSVSAIARKTGLNRKTVRKYLARGLDAPAYGPRAPWPRNLAPYEAYLRERIGACEDLSGRRLHREIRDLGYTGGYSTVTDLLREIRPRRPHPFECRFETAPGKQRRWTLPSSRSRSTRSRACAGGSGCSRSFSGTAAGCGGDSAPTRSWEPCCAAMWTPSRPARRHGGSAVRPHEDGRAGRTGRRGRGRQPVFGTGSDVQAGARGGQTVLHGIRRRGIPT